MIYTAPKILEKSGRVDRDILGNSYAQFVHSYIY